MRSQHPRRCFDPFLYLESEQNGPRNQTRKNITLHSKSFKELDKGINAAFKYYTSYYAQYSESAMQNVQVIHPVVSSLWDSFWLRPFVVSKLVAFFIEYWADAPVNCTSSSEPELSHCQHSLIIHLGTNNRQCRPPFYSCIGLFIP